MKFIERVFTFFILIFIPLGHVFAASDFLANYDISYAVSPSGKTIVTENITLINKTSGTYPKQYAITLDSTDIKNTIAYDPKGIVPIEARSLEGKTMLLLTFNTKVVGIDKALPFSLRFETDSVARKFGSIWEISIPGVPKDESIGTYDVRLSVPDNFGENSYVSPSPVDGMHWTKATLSYGGVNASYGKKQSYSLSLLYHLVNSSTREKNMSITLPPDTAYQQMLISSLDPEAAKVERDRDGNWLAQYTVKANEKLDISAQILATVYPFPRESYGKDTIVSRDYLAERPFWEVSDPSIVSLGGTYKTPEQIYTYVSTFLSYDYTRVSLGIDRLGAVGALRSNAQALCNEFTDLFIAIARASGIPARRVVGYGYTTNPKIKPLSLIVDVLHTWPEYFDEKRSVWISVDPTWANTTGGIDYFRKLDFSHIAFAINGLSSSEPKAAGMYKNEKIQSKDVLVTLSSEKIESSESPSLVLSFHLPRQVISGTYARGTLELKNTSGVAVQIEGVKVESLSHLVSLSNSTTEIPPFGNIVLPITYPLPFFPTVTRDIFTAKAGSSMARAEVLYISATLVFTVLLSLLSIGGIIYIIFLMLRRKHV
ncbi:transglutaminase domain-containing protein [Candidatus Gottesmanbacteria bacterium]|nr:transglutaminase domain-containing protein [Candidatus Gottesmanbacteria bacterium]